MNKDILSKLNKIAKQQNVRVDLTDANKTKTLKELGLVLTVSDPVINGFDAIPADIQYDQGGEKVEYNLSATILPSSYPQEVTWSINDDITGWVSIDQNGKLTIITSDRSISIFNLTVTAKSKNNPNVKVELTKMMNFY